MNDQMNAPMSPMQSSPTSFFQTWINALTKPNERTFADMAASPDARAGKAYVWVFLAALVSFFISVVVQVLSTSLGVGQQSEEIRRVMGSSVIGLICAVPFVAGFSVLGFMISTAIVQWVAGLFKGAGTFNTTGAPPPKWDRIHGWIVISSACRTTLRRPLRTGSLLLSL